MASGSTPRQPKARSQSSNTDESLHEYLFPIVGIGASAGGLDAFIKLLGQLSIGNGMAYVLIQHLDPHHKSLLTEILARTTQLPVCEVTDELEIEPDRVYIIPPNTQMILLNGRLQLSPREKTKGVYHPIDLFFRSIAVACGNQAIGVVLSGGDGDGALGLSAIATAGGITFAQDLPSSQAGGMPQHAANTGQVDFILPPAAIAEKLNEISDRSRSTTGAKSAIELPPKVEIVAIPAETSAPLDSIFELLLLHTGVDFTGYKQATIDRRMQRRMSYLRISKLEEYLIYLQTNPVEIGALYRDVLIEVTSFFRDSVVFEFLKDEILPQIVQQKFPKSPIRIWVAGCATGEEVYSVAICLLEVLADLKLPTQIQIFATDLNETAIETARAGIYSQQQVKDISAERLQQFFIAIDSGYQISKSVRELCIFAKHNLGNDPPFSQLDLIVCRNVLIYFGAKLQKKVMQTLHYGLKPTGFLMLGTSETTGGFTELFNSVDRLHKIYTKKSILSTPNSNFATDRQIGDLPQKYQLSGWSSGMAMATEPRSKIDLHQLTNDVLLKHYEPVGVVINADLEILQFRGDTSPYLMLAPGKPSINLLKMVRVNLRVELRAAIQEAKKSDLTVTKFELAELVKFEVIPFRVPGLTDRYLLILFEPLAEPLGTRIAPTPDLKPIEDPISPASPQRAITSRRVRKTMVEQENLRLRQKLALTQEHLQATLEEQEAIDRDFKAANEEMLSSNEEFQSTNEELETAKEEIQAANEELSTVNEELRHRNLESTLVNNDLLNILSSVQMPILIVDINLKIGRFTPMAEPIFNLIPADVGRSFTDIRHNLRIPDLERAIAYTIETLTVYQREIQSISGYWYHLVIRPYTTGDDRVMGVTIVLLDINEVKHRTQEIQAARDYANAIVETIVEPLLVLNNKLQIVTANRAFYQMFEVVPIEVEGQPLHEIGNGQWNIPGLRSHLKEILRHNNPFKNFKVEHNFDRIGSKTMLLNALQLFNSGGGQLILLAIVDITELEQLEVERVELLHQAQIDRAMAEKANLAKDVFLSILSHELRNPLTAMLGWSRLLLSGKLNAEQSQRGLEVIDRSATTQNQLIADLLDVSSITNGKLRLDIQTIDLIPTITAAIETVTFAAKAKNIQISTHLDPTSYKLLGDSSRLQQILWNLLGNAIKFTDPGGKITVYLSIFNFVAPPELAYAQIQVIDNGRGIEPEFLPHIFDRFLQADSSSTRSYNGLGLGLTIVRHLIELHGGSITATSEVGIGSTFTIRLPLADTTSPQPTALLLAGSIAEETDLAGICVLLVDDEADTRNLVAVSLEQYGATVTAVSDVAAALQTLQANPQKYHVLLSDIGMPTQDGWMLIRQVRSLSAADGGQIPAAALTAYVSNRDLEMALRLGFQAHIAKPIEPYKLAQIVADLARD